MQEICRTPGLIYSLYTYMYNEILHKSMEEIYTHAQQRLLKSNTTLRHSGLAVKWYTVRNFGSLTLANMIGGNIVTDWSSIHETNAFIVWVRNILPFDLLPLLMRVSELPALNWPLKSHLLHRPSSRTSRAVGPGYPIFQVVPPPQQKTRLSPPQ